MSSSQCGFLFTFFFFLLWPEYFLTLRLFLFCSISCGVERPESSRGEGERRGEGMWKGREQEAGGMSDGLHWLGHASGLIILLFHVYL